MTAHELKRRLVELRDEQIPIPGRGSTAERHRRLMQVGREDLSLAKLMEAHWDAIAILAEAGRSPVPGAIYAVWASDIPGRALCMEGKGSHYRIAGTKMFCSGAGLVDRALVSVGKPDQYLVDLNLNEHASRIAVDGSQWKTEAFRSTQTSNVSFDEVEVGSETLIGGKGWYLNRVGFWHGALGPAACWAGGVAGLLDAARLNRRDDAHTLAHLGAMHTNLWAIKAYLDVSGAEVDEQPFDLKAAMIRSLIVRHLIEQTCTDTLRRFARAYGPYPLAMDAELSRRYHEIDLYLRQSHGERDLEALAHALKRTDSR